MSVLTQAQIEEGYFKDVGGFPPSDLRNQKGNFAQEVSDYRGQDKLCIACTQLDRLGDSERDKKRILVEWIDFLKGNTKMFKALHFNSRVPQALFDAACCQENLEELRFKWGAYTDLSALGNMKKLKFLYFGPGTSVKDISIIGDLENLIVLDIENLKHIEDYSHLRKLNRLEQLVISGPTIGVTPVKDLEFLRQMQSLVSVWLPNTTIKKKYTSNELEILRKSMPFLHDIHGCIWGSTNK